MTQSDHETLLIKFLEDTPEGNKIHLILARSIVTGELIKSGEVGERTVHLRKALIRTEYAAMMLNSSSVDFDDIISWGLGSPP